MPTLIAKTKFLVILVLAAVVVSVAAGWTCGSEPLQSIKTPCKKSLSLDDGITRHASGTCHVLPCQGKNISVFAFPDSPLRRSQTEKRSLFSVPGSALASTSSPGPLFASSAEGVLKLPLPFTPAPLFTLHCILIC